MNKRILSLAAAGAIMASLVVAMLPAQAAAPAPVNFNLYSKAPGRMVTLAPVNGTKTHGLAVFVYDPLAKQTVVMVAAMGLPTGGKFFPHVETGKCGAETSTVVQLPTIVASDKYTGTSSGIVNGTWQAKDWHVSLYRKAGLIGLQRWSIACANV